MKTASYIVLVGMLSAAASTSEPYAYEPTGWHSATNQLSSYLGGNDNRRQGLAGISATGAAAAAAGVSLAASFGTAMLARQVGDDANRRIDDANERIDSTCLESKCTMIKNTADAACLKTTCQGLEAKADAACTEEKCGAIKKTADGTCAKVNMIIGIENPTMSSDTAGALNTAAPTPDPVAINLGVTAGSKELPNTYALTKVLTAKETATAANEVDAANGLAKLPAPTAFATAVDGATADNLAISVTDFNVFRIRVIDAINVLDAKIREIPALNSPTLSCV